MKKTILASAIALTTFSPMLANAITADDLEPRVTALENETQSIYESIAINAINIDAKANQSDLDATNQTIGDMQTTIQETSDFAAQNAMLIQGNTDSINALTTTVDTKADQSYVDSQNKAQDNIIANKADKAALDATNQTIGDMQTTIQETSDFAAQNAVLIQGNTDSIAALSTTVDTKADQSYVDSQNQAQDNVIANKANQSDLATTNGIVATNTQNITDLQTNKADKASLDATNQQLANNSNHINSLQQDNTAIHSTLATHDKGINNLNTGIQNLSNVVSTKVNQTDLDETNKQVSTNAKHIDTLDEETQRLENVKADKVTVAGLDNKITNEVKRLDTQNLGQNVVLDTHSNQINALGYRMDNMDKNLSAGIAGSVALAMMPSLANEGKMITGGTGHYNGESAFALGLTGTTGNVSYKVGASWVSNGESTYGAGVGYRF